ncbi:hypothetical protein G039_0301385 [Pseudomonas aeruginosa VRFPA01]|nr:hypothetical protein G039_0301385 [Pseudomonas aeruginosa VRFPA01]
MWFNGFLDLSPWQLVAVTLVLTHITIVSVTVYLHRYSAHRALDLHPALQHFFRFWLWLTTGMNTREWTAIHRKHHAKCETVEDPHSPVHKGLFTVLRAGAELYKAEAKNQDTLRIYGKNCPDDWIERNLYSRFPIGGVVLMALIDWARAMIARAIAASSTAPGRPATKPWSIFSLCTGRRLSRISEE